VLTKDEEKDLEETLEDFIYTQFQYYVQGTEIIYLVYDLEYKEFGVCPLEYAGYVYLIERPAMDWRDTLKHSFEEEVRAIITDSGEAEYDYPQVLIDNVKVLVLNADYDISSESDKILEESGAADFIKEEKTRYYIDVDTSYFEELKKEVVEAYEEYKLALEAEE
jgi:hypothetical protein